MELCDPPHRPAGDRAVAVTARAHERAASGRRNRRAREGPSPTRETGMMGLPLGFAQPLVLLGLLSLPVLWWLLRLIPPMPRRIDFPPTRLLFDIRPREEVPR